MKIDLLYLVIPTIVQLSISYMSDLDGSGAYNIGLVAHLALQHGVESLSL
jgi:hypothetical protein